MWKLENKNNPTLSEPTFFTDDAYTKLGRSVISSSNCGNPSLRLFGFGPVVPEGFGIGYIIKDDGIQVFNSTLYNIRIALI